MGLPSMQNIFVEYGLMALLMADSVDLVVPPQRRLADGTIILGKVALMQDVGAFVEPIQSEVDALRRTGRTVIYVAVNGALAGALVVGDPTKKSTPSALAAADCLLRLIGGDRSSSSVAARVRADQLPNSAARICSSSSK